jgi:Ca2+/Na+ antiporter
MGVYIPLGVVTLIFGGALIGFFKKMQRGFGPYNTSVLLLLLVLFIASLAFVDGKIEWPSVSGLLLAVAGFAGGLVSKPADPAKQ